MVGVLTIQFTSLHFIAHHCTTLVSSSLIALRSSLITKKRSSLSLAGQNTHFPIIQRSSLQNACFFTSHLSTLITPKHSSLFSHLSSLITHLSSLITHLSSLITHHSSLITHHSSLISHHSSLISHLSKTLNSPHSGAFII